MKRNLIVVYGILVAFLLVSIAILIYLIIKSSQSNLTVSESRQISSQTSPTLSISQPPQSKPQPTQPPQPKPPPTQPPQPKPQPPSSSSSITQRSPITTTYPIQKQTQSQTQIQNPNQKLPIAPNTEPPAMDKELCDLINQHRSTLNLPAVPFNNAAWLVAANHTWDSGNNKQTGSCNMHSWSDRPGAWTGCCYPSVNCMWIKPKEIAGISSRGYEIASGGGGSMTPSSALKMWLGSPLHRDVIENTGTWVNMKWTGFGCSISNGFGHCWFLD